MTLNHFSFIVAALILVTCNNSPKTEVDPSEKTEVAEDSCCSKPTTEVKSKIAEQSEITCPACGHKKMETLPTDVCLIKYNCEKCQTEMRPKSGDCCVFCTYGTHKCPSMQE